MIKKLMQTIKARGSDQLLLLFLLTDGFFIILHILQKLPPVNTAIPSFQEQAFSLTTDLSLAEGFQYTKELWMALALIMFSIKNREKAFIGWILLFFFLVFDDMFAIHENLGGVVGTNMTIPDFLASRENLRVKDFGELIVSGAFGVLFLGLISIGYLRGSKDTKATFINMFILLVTLVVFGVGVDFLDRFFNSRLLQDGVKIIEDGGEMVAMSFFCWYVLSFPESRIGKNQGAH
jgi:hypothetical protein